MFDLQNNETSILDLDAGLGPLPLVVRWEITHHCMFTFEIDTEAVEEVLPPDLEPVEVLPGRSLLSVAALRYAPGNFGPGSPAFGEIVAIIGVSPDLSLPMPLPRFSFYALNVLSDSPDFVEGERLGVGTPTELSEDLQVRFSDVGLAADVTDGRGPIASFQNTHPTPSYSQGGFFGQQFNDTRGELVVGPWQWEGGLFEHQRAGDWGQLHPHPLFRGLDVSRVRRCYMQMFARPNSNILERFYAISPLV